KINRIYRLVVVEDEVHPSEGSFGDDSFIAVSEYPYVVLFLSGKGRPQQDQACQGNHDCTFSHRCMIILVVPVFPSPVRKDRKYTPAGIWLTSILFVCLSYSWRHTSRPCALVIFSSMRPVKGSCTSSCR